MKRLWAECRHVSSEGEVTLLMWVVWRPSVIAKYRNQQLGQHEEEVDLDNWVSAVEFVLSRCNLHMVNATTAHGYTALMIAVKSAPVRIVESLIKYDAYINCEECHDYNCLHICSVRSDIEVTQTLLTYGCNLANIGRRSLLAPCDLKSKSKFSNILSEYSQFLNTHFKVWLTKFAPGLKKTYTPLCNPAQFALSDLVEEGVLTWRVHFDSLVSSKRHILFVFSAKPNGMDNQRLELVEFLDMCPAELKFFTNFINLRPLEGDGKKEWCVPFADATTGTNYVRIVYADSTGPRRYEMGDISKHLIILAPFKVTT